ncbi:ParB N-terminal domain-containing protein [Rugamonas aquatica]|uniref:ParB/RepB/Spo0J family partition protein n=1 Tax=Rugamonas aquatica TaxID=2743357 RepID=A0A6A7N6J6_9BURK|nr:hypothetical protein [Rugamonas aquatica]MQA40680.1 hypothetical protein [Rugamonas aquatica]
MSSDKVPRRNRLADRLMGATSNLEQGAATLAAQTPAAATSSSRLVTMPGQLGAFRLEAEKYQARINALESELSAALVASQAAGENVEQAAALSQRVAQLEAVRVQEQAEHSRQVELYKEQLDELARTAGQGVPVRLELIDKVPGRQRQLTVEEHAALKANLVKNKLVTPVTLTPKANGRFDTISGHNRIDIYGELERPTIQAVFDYSEQGDGDKQAFYANLMHSSLPDFAKYQGFKAMLDSSSDMTITMLAEDSGVPRSTINHLMVFDQLPALALNLLKNHPSKLGRSAASELAKLAANDHANEVVAAIEALIAGEVNQDQAVAKARALVRGLVGKRRPTSAGTPGPRANRIAGQAVVVGSNVAAEVQIAPAALSRDGVKLVLEFASEAQASAALSTLRKLLVLKE